MNRLAFACVCLLYLFIGYVQVWSNGLLPETGVREGGSRLVIGSDLLGSGLTTRYVADTTQDRALWIRPVVHAVVAGDGKEASTVSTDLPPSATLQVSDRSGNHVVSGTATYYHPSLQGEIMANGEAYNRWQSGIAASNDYPLGTRLIVSYSNSIEVVVVDRGLLGPGHIDLSEAGFTSLVGGLSVGVAGVSIEVGE